MLIDTKSLSIPYRWAVTIYEGSGKNQPIGY